MWLFGWAILCATMVLTAPTPGLAAVPNTWAVDGALSAAGGGPVADGNYAITFSLYAAASGGQAVWSEPSTVQVVGGHFHAALGLIKPIAVATVAGLKSTWLGVRVGIDPELPRQVIRSVAFASVAAQAAGLSCSGCVQASQVSTGAISADKVGFPFAAAKTKGGPAIDLQCTGCVSVSELKFDGDLDLGGNALKADKVVAKSVTANAIVASSFIGDGSKLSGIKSASGLCSKKGEVIKGIGADGSLVCVPALAGDALPADGLDAVSNGTLSARFLDLKASATTPKAIPDNSPTGMSDEITFPDAGVAQKLLVHVHLTNSDISSLTVELYDPTNAKYVLHSKSGKGKELKGTWPTPDKPVSGDLNSWIGKNPKGKWRIRILDTKFLNNKDDGELKSWSIELQTLSDKKVRATGDLLVKGEVVGGKRARFGGSVQVGPDSAKCTAANAGAMRWTGKAFEGCDGKKWGRFLGGPTGKTADTAVTSCKALKAADPQAGDGDYWIDPDGKGGPIAPAQTACDMSTDGGGWTLVVHTGSWTCSWTKDGCGDGNPWNPWVDSYGLYKGANKKFSMPVKPLSSNASGNDMEVLMTMDGKFYMMYAGADLACAFNHKGTKDCTATNNWRFKKAPGVAWTKCTTQTHGQSQWWGWTWTFNDHENKGNCAYNTNGTLLHNTNCVYNGGKGHSCFKGFSTFDIWVR